MDFTLWVIKGQNWPFSGVTSISKRISYDQFLFFPLFFTKTSSNHSSNQSFCSLLGFCFGGWRWFLSLTKSWDKRNGAGNENVSNEESFHETANAPHNPLASYTKSEEVRKVPEFEMIPTAGSQFHRCPQGKNTHVENSGAYSNIKQAFHKGDIYWVYLSRCSIITRTILQEKHISGSFYGYIWHLASINNIQYSQRL